MKQAVKFCLFLLLISVLGYGCTQQVVREIQEKPLITLEFYATTTEDDPEGIKKNILGSEKVIYLKGEPALTAVDLKQAALMDGYASKYAVLLEFKPEGAVKLGHFTRENHRKVVAIVVDGDVLTAPMIQEEILGGKSMISRPFKHGEAEAIVKRINQVLGQKK